MLIKFVCGLLEPAMQFPRIACFVSSISLILVAKIALLVVVAKRSGFVNNSSRARHVRRADESFSFFDLCDQLRVLCIGVRMVRPLSRFATLSLGERLWQSF
jgi:hypothetical protein